MSGRQFFSDTEKICLQELIIKYKLNSTATITAGNPAAKKLAWSQLVVEFNSIETNTKRTEAQLKKCWDNLKSRKKAVLRIEKQERMKTGGGAYLDDQPGTSEVLMEEALLDQTDTELQFAIDSDYVPPTEENVTGPSTSSAFNIQEPTQAEEEITVLATSVAQDDLFGVSINQGSKNIRGNVIRNEFQVRKTLYEKKMKQEDELHKLKIREQKLKNIKEKLLIQKTRLEVKAAEEALQLIILKKQKFLPENKENLY